MDDLKERRGYCHLKEEAVDRNVWRDRFGICFEPVVRLLAAAADDNDSSVEWNKHTYIIPQNYNLDTFLTL